MTESISVAPVGGRWAVKHAQDFLGFANTREEAVQAARRLVDWLRDDGRPAALVEEPSTMSGAGRGS